MFADERDYDRVEQPPEESWDLPGPPDDDDDFGYWVFDEYCWRYELNWLGIACAIEDEARMYDEMAEQHYAELAARERQSPS